MLKKRQGEVGGAPAAATKPVPTTVTVGNNVSVTVEAGKVTIPQANGTSSVVNSGSKSESDFRAAL